MIEIFYLDKTLHKREIKDLHLRKKHVLNNSIQPVHEVTEEATSQFQEELKFFESIKDKPKWVDVTRMTKAEADLLKVVFNLHDLTIEDLLHSRVRIKVEEFNHYLFCVFYAIHKNKTIELLELDFIIGDNFLITNHSKEISLYALLKSNHERIEVLLKKGKEFLFHKIIDGEVDNYFPVLTNIDELIEEIQESAIQDARPELLSRILELRRQIIVIKRTAHDQREKISFLAKNEYPFIAKKALPYFRDLYDHSIRVSNTIDNYREMVIGTFDVYMSSVSQNMNQVIKVMSIIATIALPLTLISSIYGTNFSWLPGSDHPYGFWVMMGFMVLLSGGMFYLFSKRKWL